MYTRWILRASLDGRDIQILLVQADYCYYLDSREISIDYENQLLYWLSINGIEVMSTNGSDPRLVYSDTRSLFYNGSYFTFFNDKTFYYWEFNDLYALNISIANSTSKLLYSINSCGTIEDSKIIAQQQQCKCNHTIHDNS